MKLGRVLYLLGYGTRCAYVCPGRPFFGPPAYCRNGPRHDGACDFGDSDERSETPIT